MNLLIVLVWLYRVVDNLVELLGNQHPLLKSVWKSLLGDAFASSRARGAFHSGGPGKSNTIMGVVLLLL